MLPWRIRWASWILIIFVLPPKPALPMLICFSQHSSSFSKSSFSFRHASKLCHHTATFKFFNVFHSLLHVDVINCLTFFYWWWLIMCIFKWTICMIAQNIFAWVLRSWRCLVESTKIICNWWLKENKFLLINLSNSFRKFSIKRKQ